MNNRTKNIYYLLVAVLLSLSIVKLAMPIIHIHHDDGIVNSDIESVHNSHNCVLCSMVVTPMESLPFYRFEDIIITKHHERYIISDIDIYTNNVSTPSLRGPPYFV